jgi:hypothetical protein
MSTPSKYITALAGEALSAGNIVRLEYTTSILYAWKADVDHDSAALSDCAVGFVTTNVALNGTATVYLYGVITDLTGLTAGTLYWVGQAGAPGAMPTTAGYLKQIVGVATSATTLIFNPGEPTIVPAP